MIGTVRFIQLCEIAHATSLHVSSQQNSTRKLHFPATPVRGSLHTKTLPHFLESAPKMPTTHQPTTHQPTTHQPTTHQKVSAPSKLQIECGSCQKKLPLRLTTHDEPAAVWLCAKCNIPFVACCVREALLKRARLIRLDERFFDVSGQPDISLGKRQQAIKLASRTVGMSQLDKRRPITRGARHQAGRWIRPGRKTVSIDGGQSVERRSGTRP